jgi:hypothetical protein
MLCGITFAAFSTMTIKILDIINTPNAILHEFGLKVYDQAKPALIRGEEVKLSFENLRNVTSLFCNASIGKLYMEFPDKAPNLLKVENITNEYWWESIGEAIELAQDLKRSNARKEAISDLFHHS